MLKFFQGCRDHRKTLLPPATKLGQGYVFTHVCDSVHRGVLFQHALQVVSQHPLQQVREVWYPSMPCRFLDQHPRGKLRGLARGGLQAHTLEVLQTNTWGTAPGGACSKGSAPGGCLLQRAPTLGGLFQGLWKRPHDGYCCGQYASYLNAFLFD